VDDKIMNSSLEDEVKNLYEIYGFEQLEEKSGLISFAYRVGVFNNAEIVILDNAAKGSSLKSMEDDYRKAGYNVSVFECDDYEKAHMRLFNSFFSTVNSRKGLKEEYVTFCDRQKLNLNNEYKYIEAKGDNSLSYEDGYVSHIVKSMDKNYPMLTIIEAAAGYGKTCTVFEIIRVMLEREDRELPLLIELSKNRNARIFKYVLQDEINKKFRQLSYELVLYEIKNGLIPLVIDGFDELIETSIKGEKYEDDIDEQSVTMLTTIADLLDDNSNAKIVLTSRRSAMFIGDTFDEWVGSKLSPKCEIERHQIPIPNIVDWIGEDKYKLLDVNENIVNINNPVLLSFVANNITLEELQSGEVMWDDLLDRYFKLLLEREQDRQELLLAYDEIYEIMECLAAEFARFDITSEEIKFIQELLKDITKDNILEYRIRYQNKNFIDTGILTEEEYIRRLSHNSLLDRHISENIISFINEFILGLLVGDALYDEKISASELSSQFADLVITAYENRSKIKRQKLFDLILKELDRWGIDIKIKAESKLIGMVTGEYESEYLYGEKFDNPVQLLAKFNGCTFENCVFNQCRLDAKKFCRCLFINCRFYGVTVENTFDTDTVFANCTGNGKFDIAHVDEEKAIYNIDVDERIVLEQFWKPGYATAEPRRTYTALFRGVPENKHVAVKNAIDSLKRRGLIIELKVCYGLNFEKIDEIEKILGRR
jgi:hypothetical protein